MLANTPVITDLISCSHCVCIQPWSLSVKLPELSQPLVLLDTDEVFFSLSVSVVANLYQPIFASELTQKVITALFLIIWLDIYVSCYIIQHSSDFMRSCNCDFISHNCIFRISQYSFVFYALLTIISLFMMQIMSICVFTRDGKVNTLIACNYTFIHV